ncbi:hypothetical protein LINPERPRIM_LOCUS31441 [Linum perenne]
MRAELRGAEIGLKIAWDRGYKKVHFQLDSLAAVKAILGDQEEDSTMVVRSLPLTSFNAEIGKLPFPTLFEKATELPTFLPATGTPLSSVFMLIVLTLTRLIEPFGTTMQGLVSPELFR